MKKKKQILFLAIAISTALLAARCAKPAKCYLDQETKDYLLFDVGSYWIFQDSATLKTDSIVITDIRYHITHAVSEGGNEIEAYSIDYACFYEDTNVLITGNLYSGCGTDNFKVDFLRNYFAYVSGNVGYIGAGVGYENYYHSYMAGNCMYNDVKQFGSFSMQQGQTHKIFFARHIGFIRDKTVTDTIPFTSNLIRYNVKPYNK
ncbi:MAG: hypothetical protein LBK03_02650 [Bacteroidales bacterium]|jgi:hypothetical protein|nr:hypothetical protein [Bacteroidales bacterium]